MSEEEPEEIITAEIPEEEFELAPELEFSFTSQFPTEIWGKVRIVDPLLVGFSNILVEEGFFLLSNDEARITGKVSGLGDIKYTLFPEKGCFTMLSGIIFDDSGEIKWEQDGYPIGDSYIAQDEVNNFLLVNQCETPLEPTDNLVIIAYQEGGMLEDLYVDSQEVDKGVFGVYMGNCSSLRDEAENREEDSKGKEEVQEEQVETVNGGTETQTLSNVQPIIDSVSDNLGHVNTNSWAKDTGGDWSSGGIGASPTIYIGDILTFTMNVSNSSNLQYKFLVMPAGHSAITIQDWSASNVCTWNVPKEAFGKWAVVSAQVRNNDSLDYLGFCDDYTYMTYIVLSR